MNTSEIVNGESIFMQHLVPEEDQIYRGGIGVLSLMQKCSLSDIIERWAKYARKLSLVKL